jgi:CheY-like chemotaxis protein
MSLGSTPPTVLYVEDEASDLFFMQRAFHKAQIGSWLQSVGNGQEAVDYLAGCGAYADRVRYPAPTLVLLDLNLPRLSGFEVLQWMRGRPELAALPVIIFSSSSCPEDKAKAAALGAQEYVEKPQSARGFVDVVERLKEMGLGAKAET